jgi:hypothetical protein
MIVPRVATTTPKTMVFLIIPRTTSEVKIVEKTSLPDSSKARVRILRSGKTTINRRRKTLIIKMVFVPISSLIPLFFFRALAGFSTLTVVVMVLSHNQSQRNVVWTVFLATLVKLGDEEINSLHLPVSLHIYYELIYDFGAAAIVASNFAVRAFLAAAALSKS